MHPLGLQCQHLPGSPGARPDPREAPGLLQACPGHPPPMWGETQALSRCPSVSGRRLARVWGSPVLPGSPARQNLQGAATESLERRRKHKVQDPKELLQRSNMTYSTSVLGHVFFGGVSFFGNRREGYRFSATTAGMQEHALCPQGQHRLQWVPAAEGSPWCESFPDGCRS